MRSQASTPSAPMRSAPGVGADARLSLLRPFEENSSGDVYVAMQLPESTATASYRRVRNFLYVITGLSLLLAITGSFWLAKTVTRPVQDLAQAARRMREGVYNEPINIPTADEFGELAGSFNAMQEAIADRERRIFHQAHHDSLSGLPNRELVVGLLREAIERNEKLAVVSLGLDRFNGIVSSLGHRAGDEVIKLAAAALRSRLGETEVLGHLSGHEFVIGLPGRDAREAVEWIEFQADALRAGVRALERQHLAAGDGRRRLLSRAQPGRRRALPARVERAQRGARAPRDGVRLSPRARRPLAAADPDRRRLSARAARQRAAAVLPAEARPVDRRDLRRRGARPLAASGARAPVPRLVHRGRRASRQHRASDALGAARSRRALRGVAQPGRQPRASPSTCRSTT